MVVLAMLCVLAVWNIPAAAITVTSQVSNNNDDAEERVSDGRVDRGSSDLELVFDGNTRQLVGVRFPSVDLPSGVTITNAYVQFTVDETDSGSANIVVHGQADPDPPRFRGDDFDISSRAQTTGSISWNNIPPWTTVGAQGVAQRTPNLAAIVTELIADPGWSAGNAMAFIFSAGPGCSTSACQRTAESRNGSSDDAPRLVIEYSNAPPDSADLRLTNIDSPDPVDTGKLLQYTLTAVNNGPLAATGVVLSGTLPSGVGFVSASPGQGTCSESGGVVSCALGALAVTGSVTVNIVVTAPGSPGSIAFSATVGANEPEPAPADNTATATTTVTALNEDQLCYLVADSGGGSGGDDLLTQVDTADPDPLTNETNIGSGTGTSAIEAIAWNRISGVLYGANANRLGIISTTTGVYTPRPQPFGTGTGSQGSITFSDVDGLAFDATSGVLYGSHRRGGTSDVLIQIDMGTGAHVADAFGPGIDYVPIGVVTGNNLVDDIAVDPATGTMYAAVNAGGSTDRLIIIDKATGAATDVAQITVPDIEGLGVDANGNLWGTSGTQNIIYEINKYTGLGFNGRPLDNGSDYESVDCFATSPAIVADIAVTKIIDNASPGPGETIRYTVGVSNNGTGNATVLQIADSLPAGVTFSAATPSQGSYDPDSGVWYIGNLANGAAVTLLIDAQVDPSPPAGTITNTASVLSLSQYDPFPGNDVASADFVARVPEIRIEKRSSVLDDPYSGSVNPKAIPGATTQYELLITNFSGAAPDSDTVFVVDALPSGTALVLTDFDAANQGPIAFIEGAPASGLSYTFITLGSTTDDVEFSTDGVDFTYTPVDIGDGTDPAVRHIRVRPKGAFGATAGASFRLLLKVRVL